MLSVGCGGGESQGDAGSTGTVPLLPAPAPEPTPAPSPGLLPTLSIGDISVDEGNSGLRAATLTVSLSAASTSTVTVAYATAPGSAGSGDFQSAQGTLSFTPGSTRQDISVYVVGDSSDENNEQFTVRLSNASNATIDRATGTVTIRDDDSTMPSLRISGSRVAEGQSGTTPMTLSVQLSAPTTSEVTVDYFTVDGTARRGEDYTFTQGQLRIPAGQTQASITVPVIGDTTSEGDEAFEVTLENARNATLAVTTASGVIEDDDMPTNVTLSWEAPVRNVDGSCTDDLEGFRIRAGTQPAQYTVNEEVTLGSGNVTCTQTDYDATCSAPVMTCEYQLTSLTAGTWYLAVQAFDQARNYSPNSNEISADLR
jgi:hypothetical protein